MKCPVCGMANGLHCDTCAQCGAPIAYLRDNVFLGRQFAFFNASPSQPMVVDLQPADHSRVAEQRFTDPTIISRHEFAIHFPPVPPEPPSRLSWIPRPAPRRIELPEKLPRIHLPALDLVTVTTERRIYRPEDEVHIFVVGLNCAGRKADLEVKLAGQRVYQARVTLNDAGLHLHRYTGLDEGEYTVTVDVPSRPGAHAECTFSCAEFTLSPLIAILESYQIDGRQLTVQIKLTQLNVPYNGSVEVALRSGERRVARQSIQVQDGALAAQFELHRAAWEALTVEVVTPEGNTATIALPSTRWEERERIKMSPLDVPVEASLVPFAEAEGQVRGLYYTHVREADTPFELLAVVADQGRLRALRDARLVHILAFDPITRTHRRFEFSNVAAGDELVFDVDAPYSIFTLGAFMARGRPYEAWGVVIRPVAVAASVDVPATTLPDQVIAARVQTDKPSQCLLLVYDVRLEHEDPLPKLAKQILTQIRDGTRALDAQRLERVATADPKQMAYWADYPIRYRAMEPSLGFARAAPMAEPVAVVAEMSALEAAPVTLAPLLVAAREAFPELAFIELFSVDGPVEKVIRLGDQIGTWRCRAYFFHGYDYAEITHDIEARRDVYAELDLPAIVGKGDEVFATARYHTQDAATLTITTPSGQFAHIVAGDGVVEFPLTVPGEVVTHIATDKGSDTSRRTVDPPGVETVTASRLLLLQRNETVTGRRVVVFPSIGPVLQSTINYLVNYPFG